MGNSLGKDYPEGSEIELRHFSLLRCVGKGAFGRVRIVEKKDVKKLYALKYINKLQCIRMHAIQNIFRERAILEEVNHPFLVNLRYAFQDDENMFMVLDLMTGGDLRYHLDRIGGFNEQTVQFYAAELSLALRYLHGKGIVHRDLKPDNLLLDEFGHIHITDFNIAVHFTTKNLTSHSGTLSYMAPEMFGSNGYLWQIDYWGVGIVLYEALYGKRPFRGSTNDSVTHAILNNDLIIPSHNLVTKQPLNVSPEGVSAIRGFLTRDPKRRLGCGPKGFDELKNHPWFAGWDWDAAERKQLTPIFVPSSDTANFDATYDLEELLLEDKPLTYGPRKKKKEKEEKRGTSGPDTGPSNTMAKSGIQPDVNRPIPKPPSNLTAKERIQWELNFIQENFKSFDSSVYEQYVGIVDSKTKRVSEPPVWVKNVDKKPKSGALGPGTIMAGIRVVASDLNVSKSRSGKHNADGRYKAANRSMNDNMTRSVDAIQFGSINGQELDGSHGQRPRGNSQSQKQVLKHSASMRMKLQQQMPTDDSLLQYHRSRTTPEDGRSNGENTSLSSSQHPPSKFPPLPPNPSETGSGPVYSVPRLEDMMEQNVKQNGSNSRNQSSFHGESNDMNLGQLNPPNQSMARQPSYGGDSYNPNLQHQQQLYQQHTSNPRFRGSPTNALPASSPSHMPISYVRPPAQVQQHQPQYGNQLRPSPPPSRNGGFPAPPNTPPGLNRKLSSRVQANAN